MRQRRSQAQTSGQYFTNDTIIVFFIRFGDHLDLHSFPTRRSSDLEGEARFLRAFYYYLLMDVFGGVPIATTTELKAMRSEEHTSELQSHVNLVCRLLLEKKKN